MRKGPQIFIRAVKRPETNVYSTLASLATRDSQGFSDVLMFGGINIVSGDGDRDFLAPLERTRGVRVHYAIPETYDKIKTWMPKRRAAWSYLYFLEIAKKCEQDAVVMEDDVVVANGWFRKIGQAMSEALEIDPAMNWALSAYFGFPSCPFKGSTRLVETCDSQPFWGNLMTVWPCGMLSGAHETFSKAISNSLDMSTDLTVQQHLRSVGGKLFYTNPSFAQHAGDVTTLRPDGRRRSPIYEDGFDE